MPKEMTNEEFTKELEKWSAVTERLFGVRMLHTFQCVHCGKILDDVDGIAYHRVYECKEKRVGKLGT